MGVDVELFGEHAVLVLHTRGVEKRDLVLRLEIHVEQLQQFQLVLGRERAEAEGLFADLFGRPRYQSGRAEAAALGRDTVGIERLGALVLGECLEHQPLPALQRE